MPEKPPQSPPRILLTGPPGCGKTTVVRKVVERLSERRLAGFYTREIRRAGRRLGFEAVGLRGQVVLLAHVDSRSPICVGRYGVELAEFEALVQTELERPQDDVDLFVIDEIGKMECYSDAFVRAVRRLLNENSPLLATVAQRGEGLIREARQRSDVERITVTSENRDLLPETLALRYSDFRPAIHG